MIASELDFAQAHGIERDLAMRVAQPGFPVVEPSRRLEPKYAAYVVQTADGRALTGLLVKRDENTVVLRDGQNKEITLRAKDVETLQPARQSLMPDGQLTGLTAQEAADLLEYLVTRK